MDSIEGLLSDNSNSVLANNTFDLSNSNVIFGSLNADTLLPPTNSLVFSGVGDDRINTETEDSGKRIYSGSDDDELFASIGDRLLGGVGNDILDASAGTNNRLYGGEGNDLLFAGAGDNRRCIVAGWCKLKEKIFRDRAERKNNNYELSQM